MKPKIHEYYMSITAIDNLIKELTWLKAEIPTSENHIIVKGKTLELHIYKGTPS